MTDRTTEHNALIDAARRQVERARGRAEFAASGGAGSAVSGANWPARLRGGAGTATGVGLPESPPGYQILRAIHRGGQGVVYQAVQHSTGQTVAIKIMRERLPGAAQDHVRFEREVRILSQLNHPNIVRIIDSGAWSGCRYLVMDFIDGVALDQFFGADRASQGRSITGDAAGDTSGTESFLKTFTLQRALELLATVCEAVHAAHLRGVIHRDLKPGNILVDSTGRPHVLDFGLAKRLTLDGGELTSMDQMTETGQFVGSLMWASPEQVSSDTAGIDVRSDVYSLGVIVYQMLTGAFPYRVTGSIREVADSIVTLDPMRPSGLSKRIDHELETILLKSLQKDPARRYQSAGDFARDIQRYLKGELIEAKRDSLSYALRKQITRYWAPAAVAAGFIVLLVTGLIISLSLWRTAAQERDRTQLERDKAQSINAVLHSMLASASPDVAQGREVTVAQVLDNAAGEIDGGSLQGYPAIEAAVRQTIGEAYLGLGKFEPAEAHLQAALKLYATLDDASRYDHALCLAALGRLRFEQADYKPASDLLQKALAMAMANGGEARKQTPDIMMTLSWALGGLERHDEAAAAQQQALALTEQLYGANHPQTARLKISSATRRLGGQHSIELVRQQLDIIRQTLGERHPEVVRSLRHLGAELHLKGRVDEAEQAYMEAIDLATEIYDANHHEIVETAMNLAWLYDHTDQNHKMLAVKEKYEPVARAAYGERGIRYAEYVFSMGTTLLAVGEKAKAKAKLLESLQILVATQQDGRWQGAEVRNQLAQISLNEGQLQDAETFAQESLALTTEKLDRTDFRRAVAQSILGEVRTLQGAFEQAEQLLVESQRALEPRRSMPRYHQMVLQRLVKLYDAWGAASEDESKLEQAAKWRAKLEEAASGK